MGILYFFKEDSFDFNNNPKISAFMSSLFVYLNINNINTKTLIKDLLKLAFSNNYLDIINLIDKLINK